MIGSEMPTASNPQLHKLNNEGVRDAKLEFAFCGAGINIKEKHTMQKFSAVKHCSLVFCTLLIFAEMTSSVPFYSDDENDVAGNSRDKDYQTRNRSMDIRDLYELLLKKKALDDQLSQSHQIARKSNRSPSLRLRFGKKRDPYFGNPPLIGHPVRILDDADN